jgi:hypothetical protein
MKYNCDSCRYSTDDISNFNRHNKSPKHHSKSALYTTQLNDYANINHDLNNINNDLIDADKNKTYVCKFCDFESAHMSSLSRHKSKCKILLKNKAKEDTEYNFQKIILKKDEELKKMDEEIKYYKRMAEKAGRIAEQNSKTAAKSVNALTFLMKNHTNVPALTQII